MDLDQLWQAVLGEMELTLSKASYTTWFKLTYIHSFENGKIVICVPNTFTQIWLEKKYYQDIIATVKNISKENVKEISCKIENRRYTPVKSSTNQSIAKTLGATTPSPETPKKLGINRFGLNNYYTFNSFIVGKGNELAYAACQAVAANPGKAYNPLFIYGGVGLGKTHLLQAIGNELSKNSDKILYVTSEKFSNDYINEVRSGRAKQLKEKYRNVDLLLVDDVQFMAGKDGTQEEFFHTFNELHQTNRQIVLTSDRPPKAIPALEKRLLSRFEWGMIADITQPDLETKLAILENKCHEKNFPLPDDILMYIAHNIQTNIRELEGALTRLITHYEFNNLQPTLELTKGILAATLVEFRENSITSKHVVEAVAKFFDIDMKDLIGKSRKKELVTPRQIAMFLLREEISASFPAIGQEIGGRDHTTAIHACNKINEDLKNNQKLKQQLLSIRQLLQV
ncbi:chromosomal replication initiator protein DnaA [Candidatus Falkowbacteria bacterium]|nr:MAG: chromosomal replication initiator protein DnaA [Candidatus Falkowbacteria bacterium]